MAEAPTILTTPKTRGPVLLLPYQRRWINDDSPLKLGDKSRRTGWTWAEAFDAVSRRLRNDNPRTVDYWFSSADESAAIEFIEYAEWFLKLFNRVAEKFTYGVEDEDTKRVATAFCLKFPNGTKIVAMSSNPRRFRSKGGDVCLDEFAFHDEPGKMLDAASPVTQWGGSIRVFSTPNGETSTYNTLVKNCKKVLAALGVTDFSTHDGLPSYDVMRKKAAELRISPVYSYHRVTIVDAIREGIVERINDVAGTKHTRESFLADCRAKSRSEDAFQQEYMCTPSSDGMAWLTFRVIELCEDAACPAADAGLVGYTGGPCGVGVDVGRTKDLTVITVLEEVGDVLWMRQRVELAGMSLPDQQAVLESVLRSVRCHRCCIDETGIGLGLKEYTEAKLGAYLIEGVTFTARSKESLAVGMKEVFESREIRVTENDGTLRDDLHRIRKSVTAAGNVRYEGGHTDEGHCDRFWSVALAVHAMKSQPSVMPNIEVPELTEHYY